MLIKEGFRPLLVMLVLMTALLGLSTNAVAQQDNLGILFKVQVSAANRPLVKSHKVFKDFPQLEEIYFEDGYYRYYTGSFEGYHAAKDYLDEEVKPKGYPTAYVIALRGKERMTADKAIMLIYGE